MAAYAGDARVAKEPLRPGVVERFNLLPPQGANVGRVVCDGHGTGVEGLHAHEIGADGVDDGALRAHLDGEVVGGFDDFPQLFLMRAWVVRPGCLSNGGLAGGGTYHGERPEGVGDERADVGPEIPRSEVCRVVGKGEDGPHELCARGV